MNDREKLIATRDGLVVMVNDLNAYLGAPPVEPPAGETCEQFVSRMYLQYAHTTSPDAGGYAHWVGQCRAGVPRSEIEAAFAAAYPPAQPVTPPGGNPSAIVPAWGQWDQVYPKPGFTFTPGTVAAFPVPLNPTQGADGVTLYVGQTPSQAPSVGFELCLSRTPGVIDRGDPSRYLSTGEGGFRNNLSFKVYQRVSAWNPTHDHEGFPEQGQWYLNVLVLAAVPSVHSVQWNS